MRCAARPPYFAQTAPQQRVLPEPVGPDQGVDGDAPLCEPPGVFDGRGWRLDLVDTDAVLEDMQDGVHVSLDARPQQLKDPLVAFKFLDLSG